MTASNKNFWLAAALVALALLAPVLVVEIPPLLDYPNHLARLYVLSHPTDPWLSRMYALHRAIIPNIAIDLLIPPLMHFLPVYTAGRLVVAVAVLLPVLGAIAYGRASFGRYSYWQLGAAFVTYNAVLLSGFMNFCISVGLALLFASAWIAWRRQFPLRSIAFGMLGAAVMFFMHIFGAAFYLLLIGSYDLVGLYAAWKKRAGFVKAFALSAAGLIAVAAVPAVLSMLSAAGKASLDPRWSKAIRRLFHLFVPFINYQWQWDIPAGLIILAFIAFCLWRKYLVAAPHTVICAIILLAIYSICPEFMMQTAYVDVRWSTMLGFLPFAGIQPVAMPRRVRQIAVVLVGILALVKLTIITDVWHHSNNDIAELRQTLAPVPPGARVLALQMTREDNPDYWHHMPRSREISHYIETFQHMPALLVIEHQAFWPGLFSSRFKQPVTVLPPYREISVEEGNLPDYSAIEDNELDDDDLDDAPYLADWQKRFDYVLVLPGGELPDAPHWLPGKLTYVRGTDMAALYAIKKF